MSAFKERAKAELAKTPRIDLLVIAGMVEPGARVPSGLRQGELLKLLEEQKQVDGRGIELKQSRVNFCVGRGLSVVQGDADNDLASYPDQAFDYAILTARCKPRTGRRRCWRSCCASRGA